MVRQNGTAPSTQRNRRSARDGLVKVASKKEDTTSLLSAVTARTYRVPTRKVYKKIRIDENLSWDDVYGNKRCYICHKKMKEKDVYRMTNDHRGYHVNCEPTGNTNKKPKE